MEENCYCNIKHFSNTVLKKKKKKLLYNLSNYYMCMYCIFSETLFTMILW